MNALTPGESEKTLFTVSLDDSGPPVSNGSEISVLTTSVNDAPVLGGAVANQPGGDDSTIAPFAGLTVVDPDVESATVTVTIQNGANRGDFTSVSATGWTRTPSGSDIVYTRSFAGETSIAGVPFDPIWRGLLTPAALYEPAVTMTITCLVAALYPAILAARLEPVRAMQRV